MAYNKKTSYFGIPYVSKGESVNGDEEEKATNIIENQLLAGMKGVKCSVFEEGYFKIIDNNDGTFLVSLSKHSTIFALCGIVGGAYVESEEPIIWDGLEGGCKYFLYIQYTDTLFTDEHSFRLCFSTTPKSDNNGLFLLMASVDLTGTNRIVNSNPDGKIYSNDIATHVVESENPHGEILNQNVLIVNEKIEIDIQDNFLESCILLNDKRTDILKGKVPTIESTSELNFKDKRIEMSLTDDDNKYLKTENKTLIGAINELGSLKTKIIEIETVGIQGAIISIENSEKIEFIGYNKVQIGSIIKFENIGNVVIGYFGEDESVQNKSSFKFYNDGIVGIKIKLLVNYR